MKNLLIAIGMITILSCTKEAGIKTPDALPNYSESLKAQDTIQKIKVFLYTNAGALAQDAVYNFGLDYRTNVHAIDVYTDALWYVHHRLQTADTTLAYLYPYTIVKTTVGNVYVHPDDALQADPDFDNFLIWFNHVTTNWMSKHECTECSNIIVSPGTSQFFSKITCSVN